MNNELSGPFPDLILKPSGNKHTTNNATIVQLFPNSISVKRSDNMTQEKRTSVLSLSRPSEINQRLSWSLVVLITLRFIDPLTRPFVSTKLKQDTAIQRNPQEN